jgi:predicted dithiol-disulfide oxidoreductase (DUF899 family)
MDMGDDVQLHELMTASSPRTGFHGTPCAARKPMTSIVAHPRAASHDQWLTERKTLLAHEKALSKSLDLVNAERRRLPMVKIEKDYVFDGPGGKQGLADLFDGRRQLIVYHFMFDAAWDKGCPACTSWADALGDLSALADRDTTLVLVSRAPLAKLDAYKAQRGWSLPWFSSFGSDFNYDFHVTLDANVAPVEYNYRPKAEMLAQKTPAGRKARSTASASSSPSTARCSTLTRPTAAAPGVYMTPTRCSIPRPMADSRTSRTLLPAGRRSRPTDRSRRAPTSHTARLPEPRKGERRDQPSQ